jgi:hypothetical protein
MGLRDRDSTREARRTRLTHKPLCTLIDRQASAPPQPPRTPTLPPPPCVRGRTLRACGRSGAANQQYKNWAMCAGCEGRSKGQHCVASKQGSGPAAVSASMRHRRWAFGMRYLVVEHGGPVQSDAGVQPTDARGNAQGRVHDPHTHVQGAPGASHVQQQDQEVRLREAKGRKGVTPTWPVRVVGPWSQLALC